MNINNVFWGVLSTVTTIDYDYPSSTYHIKKVDYILYYNDGKYAVDIISKKKYPFDPTRLDIGQQFVDIKNYQMVPFLDYITEIEKELGRKIDIKLNISRRKIIRLLKETAEEMILKEIEREKVKKLIRIQKGGGKR